jgi:hypothetical protein
VSASLLFFLFFALVVLALLLWASRSSKHQFAPDMDVFEALSQSRHCSRLAQILQALRPEDTEYLQQIGQAALMQALRQQRRRIARTYLDCLQEEFETLLEISRALAVMSPEVVGMEEMQRWRLSLAFAANCAFLRWRLRLGLRPFAGFTLLSDMATDIAGQLDTATTRIAEAAVRGSEPSAPGHENIGGR